MKKNILWLAKDNVDEIHKILVPIIQCANDTDVGLFIINCFMHAKSEQEDIKLIFEENFYTTYKELLISLFIYKIILFTQSSKLTKIITKHLRAIMYCFEGYQLSYDDENYNEEIPKQEPIVKDVRELNLGIEQVTIELNKILNLKSITRDEFAKFFNAVVECYRTNNFYYTIVGDVRIDKIEFKYTNRGKLTRDIIQYKLVNSDRFPHVVDPVTGLNIGIGRKIKDNFAPKKGILEPKANTFDYFIGAHDRIVKALSYKPTPCCWCNPDKSSYNKKVKCENCKNLLDNLNQLKKTTSKIELKNIDFNKYLNSNEIKAAKNIAEVRTMRKEKLEKFLKEIRNSKNAELVDETKMLAKKAFSLNVV